MPGRRRRWEGPEEGGRRQQTSRINPFLHGSQGGTTSTSRTSTFDNSVPPGPRVWVLAAERGLEASWPPRNQRHARTQPEAPASCARSPSPSLAINHAVNICIFTAEKESERQPRAAASAAQGQHAALNSAFVPALLFIPEAPSAPLSQTKSSWPPRTKTPGSLAQPSRAPAPGGKVGTQVAGPRRVRRMLSVVQTRWLSPGKNLAAPFPPWLPLAPPSAVVAVAPSPSWLRD